MRRFQDLHPEMRALIERRTATSGASTDPVARRRAWNAYSKTLGGDRPEALLIRDHEIPTERGPIAVRVYRHADQGQAPAPCAVYFHGGGFVLGDLDSSDFVAWGIACQARCAVVSIDYPLSPEHAFPAAFDAATACTTWIARHGASIGVDGSRLVLAGDSAGGNLAAATCVEMRDQGGPSILGQALAYPWLAATSDQNSRLLYANGFGLTTAGLAAYAADYMGAVDHRRDPRAFPLNGENFSDLPPAWIHVAECDPVRDDGREYARRLIEAGVEVHYREVPCSVHAFLRAWRIGPTAASEFAAFAGFIGARLGTR